MATPVLDVAPSVAAGGTTDPPAGDTVAVAKDIFAGLDDDDDEVAPVKETCDQARV